MQKTYLSEREFAERYHISQRSAQRMRQTGEGPAFIRVTAGRKGRVVYAEEDVEVWATSRRRHSTSEGWLTGDGAGALE